MNGIQSNTPSVDTQIYAMKKATEVKEQNMMKVLEGLSGNMQSSSNPQSGSELTGIGQKLDISV